MQTTWIRCLTGRRKVWLFLALVSFSLSPALSEDVPLTLQRLVAPTTVYVKDGKPVPFAIHGFIEFQTLRQFFKYVDTESGRWTFESAREREKFADQLLRRGVESRLVSMVYQKPLEVLLTHTTKEIARSVRSLQGSAQPWIFQGEHWHLDPEQYLEKLLGVQRRWRESLNCWSASSSIAGRVLSNWYLIDEGIPLFGAVYDSTEHFWQAVKYHRVVTIGDLAGLLDHLEAIDWSRWVGQLANDQELYIRDGYSVEFLRHNLTPERLAWFRGQLRANGLKADDFAREVQQRDPGQGRRFRFSALQEKVLWGDLADIFHLIHRYAGQGDYGSSTPGMKPLLEALRQLHFDGIYLDGYRDGKVGFVSEEFQLLMLEIWKTKYLKMERFGEVIRSTRGKRLDHFLNDGDSPDIPIPVYVGFLEQIRDEALKQARR